MPIPLFPLHDSPAGNIFPSDVVAGSTIGYLIGRHIFHEHRKADLSPICEKQ